MTLRRWTILSVILLVPGFVLQFLSRTVFVPEAGVIGGLLLAAGLAIQLFVIRCPECGAHLPLFPGEYCKYCGNRLDWDKPFSSSPYSIPLFSIIPEKPRHQRGFLTS